MPDTRALLRIASIPVILASLCCLSPLILVLLGLGTVSFASSLADTLYGEYRWYFRALGLVALIASLVFYFRRERGICTIDDAKRRRNEVLNIAALALLVGTLGYLFFLYVVVHWAGVWVNIWE